MVVESLEYCHIAIIIEKENMNTFIVLSGPRQYIHRHVLKLERSATLEDRLPTFVRNFSSKVVPAHNGFQF